MKNIWVSMSVLALCAWSCDPADLQTGTSSSGGSTSFDPQITDMMPAASRLMGDVITFHGTNFRYDNDLYIGGKLCENLVFKDDQTMTCQVPSQSSDGNYDIEIVRSNGKRYTFAGRMIYTSQVLPSISSVSPMMMDVNGGSTLTIVGTGFKPGLRVTVDNHPCSSAVLNGNTITCTAPENFPGPSSVHVYNPDTNGPYTGLGAGMDNALVYSGAVSFGILSRGIFAQGCVSCHSFMSSYQYVDSNADDIYNRLNSGNMPAGGGRLPQRAIDAMKAWRDNPSRPQ